MANIVRKGESRELVPSGRGEWDPFRVMRDILRWDPFSEMVPFVGHERGGTFAPHFEVKETGDSYLFKADLPGVKESDLEIQVTGSRLTVSGKREAEERHEGETYYAYERTYGSFTRAFTLPDGVDDEHVQAELRDGVLTLTVPKKPELQPKKISLKSGAPTQKSGGKA
jgi:HSP20 family protein